MFPSVDDNEFFISSKLLSGFKYIKLATRGQENGLSTHADNGAHSFLVIMISVCELILTLSKNVDEIETDGKGTNKINFK